MFKPKRMIMLLLITFFLLSLTMTVIAKETRENQPNPKPTVNQPRKTQSIWESIWQLWTSRQKKEPALASRGLICQISPGVLGSKNIIWNTQPLFIWQANASENTVAVEILLYRPFDATRDPEVMWRQKVTLGSSSDNTYYILYTGQESLQPGQSYDWKLVSLHNSDDPNDYKSDKNNYSFQLLLSPERDRITNDLKTLETRLLAAGATPEQIALKKAEYFAKNELWSDSLQEMYSVQNPSEDLKHKVQELSSNLCNVSNSVGSQN